MPSSWVVLVLVLAMIPNKAIADEEGKKFVLNIGHTTNIFIKT